MIFNFSIAYFPNATIQTDLTPAKTIDGWNLFYNTTYDSMNSAIAAFNEKHATNIPLLDDQNLNPGTAINIPLTMNQLNEYTRGCSMPLILLFYYPGQVKSQIMPGVDMLIIRLMQAQNY